MLKKSIFYSFYFRAACAVHILIPILKGLSHNEKLKNPE